MNETPFTKRNVAKWLVKGIVYAKVADKAEDVIVDYTHFEEGDLTVNLARGAIGWYVSDKLKPYTDKMVDKTADFIVAKRAERAAKKDTPSEQ